LALLLLLLVRMRTRSPLLLLWQSWCGSMKCLFNLFLLLSLPSSSSLFLLPSSRAVGSKVSLLPASLSLSLLPAWSQERAQGLQREYSQCCVSMFQPFLSFQTVKKLFPRSTRLARSENGQDRGGGGRAGRESFSCPSQSLPSPLYHPSSSSLSTRLFRQDHEARKEEEFSSLSSAEAGSLRLGGCVSLLRSLPVSRSLSPLSLHSFQLTAACHETKREGPGERAAEQQDRGGRSRAGRRKRLSGQGSGFRVYSKLHPVYLARWSFVAMPRAMPRARNPTQSQRTEEPKSGKGKREQLPGQTGRKPPLLACSDGCQDLYPLARCLWPLLQG